MTPQALPCDDYAPTGRLLAAPLARRARTRSRTLTITIHSHSRTRHLDTIIAGPRDKDLDLVGEVVSYEGIYRSAMYEVPKG